MVLVWPSHAWIKGEALWQLVTRLEAVQIVDGRIGRKLCGRGLRYDLYLRGRNRVLSDHVVLHPLRVDYNGLRKVAPRRIYPIAPLQLGRAEELRIMQMLEIVRIVNAR
jgi:hypothetical protein